MALNRRRLILRELALFHALQSHERVQIGLDRSDNNVGVSTVAGYFRLAFVQTHGNLALRITAVCDVTHRI